MFARRLASRLARPTWRDAVAAGGCFAVGALLYAVGLTAPFGADDATLGQQLVPLAVACAGQPWRRTAPLTALGVGLVGMGLDFVAGPTIPVVLVLTDLLYSATLRSGRRTSRVVVAASGAAVLLSAVLSTLVTDDWRTALVMPVQLGLVVLIPVWWALNIRQHRELAAAERERAEQVARIAELDRRAAIADERSRMARDLHDVVAGQLSAIAIQSEALLSGAGDTGTVLRSVRQNSLAALEEMRAMIGVLQGDAADARTAPARLGELDALVTSARASGVPVELELGELPDLPVAADLAAYRITQEALTNVAKHAPGARTTVRVYAGERLVVDVDNELPEGAGPRGSGTGLVSMRERAESVGGTFTAGPEGGHWRLVAELPIGGRQ